MVFPIEYRKMGHDDASRVFTFISNVFNQFVASEFSQEGVDEFMKYIQPDELIRHIESNHFALIAAIDDEIIGVIVLRDYNHVALFFVNASHQGKGVGKELLLRASKICARHDTDPSQITVNASPNSSATYLNLGFEPTDVEQCMSGIRFIPMVLRLRRTGSETIGAAGPSSPQNR